ncbi:hypothetical protein F444_00202 [Phytophthora nicotianae P1976]|uniref:EF-hand domain-containing protein n=2 Tax=Phytophthora nicotianae TaxID=4792 RepID=A0A081B511_PHYNI|nr:hypothetical protein F444_00202 [Phytophthora nicotianae P1976]
MMEGEPGTPIRLPDEETAFIGRKVEAPKRQQRLQQKRAQKKRLAVLTISAVTVLAVGTVCVFLQSTTSNQVKTAASQAMASDPAGAASNAVTVPSFSVYDEDGDGQVTLGEYLDRLAINRDAALQRVGESGLNETEKDRITDLLREDFDKHSNCVARIAQQHDDKVMTEQNFDEKYKKLTTEYCPINDDRIPDKYQAKEIAPSQEESSEAEANAGGESAASEGSSASRGSQSSSEAHWNPDKPVAPPRPVTDYKESKIQEGITGSQPGEEKPWRPNFPTEPPIPSSADDKTWGPNYPTDPPVPSKATSPENEPEWNPTVPTNPPRAAKNTEDSSASKPEGVGSTAWNPEFPMEPPKQQDREFQSDNNKDKYESSPAGVAREPMAEMAPEGEQAMHAYNTYTGKDTGAYNAYTGGEGESTKYGENMRTEPSPEGAAYGSPITEMAPQGEQPMRAYNTYTGAETGAYNAYMGAETTKYGENINTYAGADTSAYNAYTGGESTKYGEKVRTESSPPQGGAGEWMSLVGGNVEPESEAQLEKSKENLRGMTRANVP